MKFRVEVEERTMITRETWIEAESAEAAREAVEAMDWRTFSYVASDAHYEITNIEVVS